MIQNINYHIWFKCCRPIKGKYQLSTNCLLILNGCYLFSRVKSKGFSRRGLLSFMTYYDMHKLNDYFVVLRSKGYIVECGARGMYPLYKISESGVKVIEELMISYQNTFDKFIDTHKIVL